MDIDFKFVGWVNEGNHDKVWVAFSADHGYAHYCAWARRGAKLQFKQHTARSLHNVRWKKGGKYKEVDKFTLFSLFPDFEDKVAEELQSSLEADLVR